MTRFISASAGENGSVIYVGSDGISVMYSGGARAWRNNNPGNLRTGSVSRRNAQIGTAGGFAVFPDYDSGHAALADLLINVYGQKSLKQMIRAYAPAEENNTERYLVFLLQNTGVRDDRKIKDFSAKQFDNLLSAIERKEGRQLGAIQILPVPRQILEAREGDDGAIFEYLIEGLGWLKRARVIRMIKAGEIDAVVVKKSNGVEYVRSRPDQTRANNLSRKKMRKPRRRRRQ